MANLKRVLLGVSENLEKAGGAVSRQAKSALRTHRKQRLAAATVLAVFVICWVALAVYFNITNRASEGRQVLALAGIGGTGGALEALRRIWKDYSQTDLLLILIEDASEAQVVALISKLIKGL